MRIFLPALPQSHLWVSLQESQAGKWDSTNIPELLLEMGMMSMTEALEQPLINNSDDNGGIITY